MSQPVNYEQELLRVMAAFGCTNVNEVIVIAHQIEDGKAATVNLPTDKLPSIPTPRTDVVALDEREGITHPELCETYMAWTDYWALRELSRQLERELAQAKADLAEVDAANVRLARQAQSVPSASAITSTNEEAARFACEIERHMAIMWSLAPDREAQREQDRVLGVWMAKNAESIAKTLRCVQPEGASNALRELVRLKDIHDHIEAVAFETMDEYRAAVQEYNKCKPKAWAAARIAIEPPENAPTGPGSRS